MRIITAESSNLSNKLFSSKEFFPIEVNFGDKEAIKITKRPRKTTTEIIDIYAKTTHIGMFVSIEKTGDVLKFGPAGVNKSHSFRGILNFTFVKLLEYFGLNGVSAIVIDVPEDYEFKNFLQSLGFLVKSNRMKLELTEENTKQFSEVLDQNPPEIKSQVGQIETIIMANGEGMQPNVVKNMVDSIVGKIKNMDPLGKEFWDNRQIAQINTILSSARLFKAQLVKEEFLELVLKTIVASFDTYNREPYLEELFWALEGKRDFTMPYIQKMAIKIKDLLPKEIEELNKDHLRKWVSDNMEGWKVTDSVRESTRQDTIAKAQLSYVDFGVILKENMKSIVESLVNHYNGSNLFFGMENRF